MYKSTVLLTTFASTLLLTQPVTHAQEVGPQEAADKLSTPSFSALLTTTDILKVSNAVADWQLQNPSKKPDTDWTNGALWTGIVAHVHTSGNKHYSDHLRDMSKRNEYHLGPRPGFGDDHAVGRAHLWQYMQDELPHQLAPTEKIFQDFITRPHEEPLFWVNKIHLREWAWCDALYMSPPTLAILHSATGNADYLDTMDKLWWKTTDYLYDKESHLFFRDSTYFDRKEKNGEKVFWARGNGWVIAGLCHTLENMPSDYPTRPKYEKLFVEMAAKLKAIQREDGSWSTALLDPVTYTAPESSGTAFFTYAFTWGINHGLLEKDQYMPSIEKGWHRLVKNVHPNGKLGFVQAIGKDPQSVTMDETETYGVGGFLLASHELHKLKLTEGSTHHDITVTNPSSLNRLNSVIELDWNQASSKFAGLTEQNIAVQDTRTGQFLPIQLFDKDLDGTPETLLTKINLTPNETNKLRIYKLTNEQPAFLPSQLHLRFVPERHDDFAWENDRQAFRMYGPALAKVEKPSSGVDIWNKRSRGLVIDDWYKEGPSKYHKDRGNGMDAYKVGYTLGAGGLGFIDKDKKLTVGPQFKTWKILDKGPLRLRFQLTYDPVEIATGKVSEIRTITMDSGSHFLTTQSEFQTEGNVTGIRPATGLYVHQPEKLKTGGFEHPQQIMQTDQAIALWEMLGTEKNNAGNIGTAIILPEGGIVSKFKKGQNNTHLVRRDDKHIYVQLAASLKRPVEWQVGTMWEQVDAPTERQFRTHVLNHVHETTNQPIKIQF
ncbi:MAG: glycoside hydrolase family 88 protein [Akkermansiaceae bacterium]